MAYFIYAEDGLFFEKYAYFTEGRDFILESISGPSFFSWSEAKKIRCVIHKNAERRKKGGETRGFLSLSP